MIDTRSSFAFEPTLLLPPHSHPLLLPPHSCPLLPTITEIPLQPAHTATRNSPIAYDYHGLRLYISPIAKHGTITTLAVSYREPATSNRSKSEMGKILLKLVYRPKCDQALPVDQPIPSEVISATLDSVLPTLFLPKLFAAQPQIKTDELSFAVLGPYALQRLQAFRDCKESTKIDQVRAMNKMLALWGDQPLRNITPEACAKDLLEQMPFSTAEECVRVLRQIFLAEFSNVVKDPHVWERYHLSRKENTYSATRVIRARLLDNPLPAAVIADIVDISMQHITDPTLGGRYLGALCLVLEAISLEEACALTAGSLVKLRQYPGKHAIRVDHQINTHGSRSRGDGHIRDQRHTRDLILDNYQNRDIGVCDIVEQAWSLFCSSHTADEDALIMTNPANPDRVLSPDTYDAWLADTFRVQLDQQAVYLGDEKVHGTCTAADRLAATAVSLMREQGRMTAEEIHYHIGERPKKMDAKHYAGFHEEATLSSIGEKLTCACQAIYRNRYSEKTSPRTRKEYMAEGVPGRMTMVNITIKIPPTISQRDLLLLVTSRFGFSAEISAI